MLRRSLIAATALAAVAPLGCGLMPRKPGGALFGAGLESRTFREPPHRVALATLEAMRAELASADFAPGRDSQFAPAIDLMQPGMKIPRPGEATPPDYPAFWVDWTAQGDGHKERNLVVLQHAAFAGTTRDGRPVEVAVSRDFGTIVSIRVGRHGEAQVGRALLDRVADRLSRPLHPPGSPEEAETLRAFFGGVESREAIPSLRVPAPGAPGGR